VLTILMDPSDTPDDKKKLTRLLGDTRSALVVMASTNVEELLSVTARTEAIKKAAELGLPNAGVSHQSGTYPVNAAGIMSEECIKGEEPVETYRQEFTLMASR
jgi:hypothetical protein